MIKVGRYRLNTFLRYIEVPIGSNTFEFGWQEDSNPKVLDGELISVTFNLKKPYEDLMLESPDKIFRKHCKTIVGGTLKDNKEFFRRTFFETPENFLKKYKNNLESLPPDLLTKHPALNQNDWKRILGWAESMSERTTLIDKDMIIRYFPSTEFVLKN